MLLPAVVQQAKMLSHDFLKEYRKELGDVFSEIVGLTNARTRARTRPPKGKPQQINQVTGCALLPLGVASFLCG